MQTNLSQDVALHLAYLKESDARRAARWKSAKSTAGSILRGTVKYGGEALGKLAYATGAAIVLVANGTNAIVQARQDKADRERLDQVSMDQVGMPYGALVKEYQTCQAQLAQAVSLGNPELMQLHSRQVAERQAALREVGQAYKQAREDHFKDVIAAHSFRRPVKQKLNIDPRQYGDIRQTAGTTGYEEEGDHFVSEEDLPPKIKNIIRGKDEAPEKEPRASFLSRARGALSETYRGARKKVDKWVVKYQDKREERARRRQEPRARDLEEQVVATPPSERDLGAQVRSDDVIADSRTRPYTPPREVLTLEGDRAEGQATISKPLMQDSTEALITLETFADQDYESPTDIGRDSGVSSATPPNDTIRLESYSDKGGPSSKQVEDYIRGLGQEPRRDNGDTDAFDLNRSIIKTDHDEQPGET